MSAMMLDPSLMLLVSRKGESVPPVSWWSRPSITGPISPRRTISLNFRAMFMRPMASWYRMRHWVPTTSLLRLASRTQM